MINWNRTNFYIYPRQGFTASSVIFYIIILRDGVRDAGQ
jgi:hypothetical protein